MVCLGCSTTAPTQGTRQTPCKPVTPYIPATPNRGGISTPLATVEEFNRLTEPTPPELRDVLDCLVSDTQSVCYGQSFREWCNDLGYSPDSIKALKAYKGCMREWHGLTRLGADIEKLARELEEVDE